MDLLSFFAGIGVSAAGVFFGGRYLAGKFLALSRTQVALPGSEPDRILKMLETEVRALSKREPAVPKPTWPLEEQARTLAALYEKTAELHQAVHHMATMIERVAASGDKPERHDTAWHELIRKVVAASNELKLFAVRSRIFFPVAVANTTAEAIAEFDRTMLQSASDATVTVAATTVAAALAQRGKLRGLDERLRGTLDLIEGEFRALL